MTSLAVSFHPERSRLSHVGLGMMLLKSLGRGLWAIAALCLWVATARGEETNDAAVAEFERQCDGVARLIEKDLVAKNAGFLREHFDLGACLDRVFHGLHAAPRKEREFRNECRAAFLEPFGTGLLSASSVKYLRLHRVGPEPRFLFRVVPRAGGVQYVEAIFKHHDNSVKVVDFYLLATGQNFSDTLRQTVLADLGDPRRGLIDRLMVEETDYYNYIVEITALYRAVQSQNFREAADRFAKLPASLQKEQALLSAQIQCTVQIDAAAHATALDLWRTTYPGDPFPEFLAMNLCVIRKQHQPFFAALDRLENSLGGDPFLDVIRARHYHALGKFEQTKKFARQAVRREPRLVEGYDCLLGLSLQEGNFSDTARWLDEWEMASGMDALRLVEGERFIEFVRSEPGRQWLGTRENRDPVVAAKKPPGEGTASPSHKLQGIFFGLANPSAIISGRTVFTGDRLQGGYRVEEISREGVMLKSNSGEQVMLALPKPSDLSE